MIARSSDVGSSCVPAVGPLSILMLSNLYRPIIGGLERGVAATAEGLVARGHRVTVATLAVDGQPAEEIVDGVRVVRMRSSLQLAGVRFDDPLHPFVAPLADPVLSRRLRAVARDGFDVVHSHDWLVHSWPELHGSDRPVHVHTAHDYALLCPKRTLQRTLGGTRTACPGPDLRTCLRCAPEQYGTARGVLLTSARAASARRHGRIDQLISISSAVARAHRTDRSVLRRPTKVVPEFVPDGLPELARSAARPDWLPSRPYLLFVGALGPHKGLHVLFDAWQRLRERGPAPELVCLGTPRPDMPLVPEGVHVRLNVPHEEVMAAWHHAEVGIVPSVWDEPLGLVAVEAMLAGTPVVATAVGGLVDVVIDGVTGLTVAPDDASALADAIARVLADPTLASAVRSAASEHALEFTASRCVARIESVYLGLLGAAALA